MIRIALLLDSMTVPAWVFECILQVTKVPNARLVLAVINESPKSSGEKSPFLYRVYRYLDRKLLLKQPDAFEKKNLTSIPGWNVPKLRTKPIQKKYSDYFTSDTLEQIKLAKPDVILRFGFRIIKGDILNLAPLGVWSYHHGDPHYYRGGPPAFWEVMNKQAVTSAVLMRITEKLDQGKILYQSFTQTDPLSVQRNANRLFWLSSFFVARVLKRIDQLGLENWERKIQISSESKPSPLLKPPGTWAMWALGWNLGLRTIKRKLAEQRHKPHWSLARIGSLSSERKIQLTPEQTQIWEHPHPKEFYWADPFPICVGSKNYVFAEEMDKKSGKGRIVCLEEKPDEIAVHPVLEEPWHFSYPFVWEENDKVYLMPESAEAGKIYRYRAEEFPKVWVKESLFFDGEAYDPTLLFKDGIYWLFVNQKVHPACSPFDELFLYYTSDLAHPQWISHPQNPIVSDVRKSRPAGRIFEKGGKWYRPAQDSGLRYGHRIQLQEIQTLSTEQYEEITAQTIEPDPKSEALGIHTLNWGENGVFLDYYFRR